MRTLNEAVLQVKASCFSRTVGDAGPYKLVRTRCDFPKQMIFSRSRKRTFHICEANISLRSNFTCPLGQISLRYCFAVALWVPKNLREQFYRPLRSDKFSLLYFRTAHSTPYIKNKAPNAKRVVFSDSFCVWRLKCDKSS